MLRILAPLFLFLQLSYQAGISQPVITISDSLYLYEIGDKLSLLEDSSGKLGLTEVLSEKTKFIPSEREVPTWGATHSAIWAAFTVKNESSLDDWLLEIAYPTIHELDFYSQNPDGTFDHQETGSRVFFDSGYIRSNHLVVPLKVYPGESRTFYFRGKSRNSIRLPVRIATTQALYEKNHPKDFINSIYYGLIIALILYNIFIYIKIRDITYLYYVFYIFFFGLNLAYLQGYAFEFIDNKTYTYTGGLSIIFGTLFSTSFLRLKSYSKFWYHLQWLPLGFVAISFTLMFMGNYNTGFKFILANPAFLYTLVIGIVAYSKGFKPAGLYVFAFSCLVASVVFFVLTGYRVFPVNSFTEHIMQIGSGAEALALSLALAYKFNYYRKERLLIQNKALEQSVHFSHLLIQSQENEKKRISAELHDSLGQKLVLIKNKIHLLMADLQSKGGNVLPYANLNESLALTIQEVRGISYNLHPFQLDLLGLTQSLESLIEDVSEAGKIKIRSEIDFIDGIFSKDNEINIYRIVQESLNNIVKHSEAREANVWIKKKGDVLNILIEDFGKGFMNPESSEGLGLSGIKERVKILKGKIVISDTVPQGTSVSVVIPLK